MNTAIALISVSAASAIACAGFLWLLLRTGLAWRLAVDTPNERSLHAKPVPRTGGWGVIGVCIPLLLVLAPSLRWIGLIAVALALFSYLDDRRGLSARTRLAVHLVAAALVPVAYASALPPWWIPLIVLFIAWLINLYNFMDGSDGLAGGMALFGFGSFAIAAYPGEPELALAAAAIAGAAAGFLVWNLHPATMFLGDAGSVPLGFLAGALGYWGWYRELWPIWFPILVFSPFIADATATLVKRSLRRERIWEAHREHYYQRMVRMGWGHGRTALAWYLAMILSGALALLLRNAPVGVQLMGLSAASTCFVVIGLGIDRRWARFLQMESAQ